MMKKTLLSLACLLLSTIQFAYSNSEYRGFTLLNDALRQAFDDQQSFDDPYAGDVWLATMSTNLARFIKDPDERTALLKAVHSEAKRAGLEPGLVLAVIQVESAFDSYAISYAGALGLMQIMPFWKNDIGRETDNLLDARTNLRYGTTILAHYIEVEKGSVIRALARYNGSRGQTWYPQRVLNFWHQNWRSGEAN